MSNSRKNLPFSETNEDQQALKKILDQAPESSSEFNDCHEKKLNDILQQQEKLEDISKTEVNKILQTDSSASSELDELDKEKLKILIQQNEESNLASPQQSKQNNNDKKLISIQPDHDRKNELTILFSSKLNKNSLDLSACNIWDDDLPYLIQFINSHSTITHLDLSINSISDHGAKLLANNKYLTSLDLSSTKTTINSIKYLAANGGLELKLHSSVTPESKYIKHQQRFSSTGFFPKFKSAENFTDEKDFKAKNHLHSLKQVRKKPKKSLKSLLGFTNRNSKIWIKKQLQKQTDQHQTLIKECLAQELIRMLLDPNPKHHSLQPKTRTVITKNGERSLISEKVDFTPIAEVKDFLKNVKLGAITGMGNVAACSVLVADSDRHTNNFGINERNQMITIDNGHSFHSDTTYQISEQLIEELPFISKENSYFPSNWFRLINNKTRTTNEDRALVDVELSQKINIRHEINQTFMKFLILPNELIEKFVESYTDHTDEIETYSKYLIQRKEQLLDVILKNNSFKEYLLSNIAEKDVDSYLAELPKFKTIGKNYLISPKSIPIIIDNFKKIQDGAKEISHTWVLRS